jgi:hypothetical protein
MTRYIIHTDRGGYIQRRLTGAWSTPSWRNTFERDEAYRFLSRKNAEWFIKDGNYRDHTIEEVDE